MPFTDSSTYLLLYTFVMVSLYLGFFILSKFVKDLLVPYKLNKELLHDNNLAAALTLAGYYVAITLIFVGALMGPSQGLVKDIMLVSLYSTLGLIFLNVSRWINDRFILRKFSNVEQLTEKNNIAVGAVQFGTYVATGFIAAGAISGIGGGILSSLVFFVLGQIVLILFSYIYDGITHFHIHEELEKQNIAAGVAFSGILIALGIIICNGSSGTFIDWKHDIIQFLSATLLAFFFLPLIHFLIDRLIVPGQRVQHMIAKNNIGMGTLDALAMISFAMVLATAI